MGNAIWHPKWWDEGRHGSAWERIKEAMKRDWEQTKNDLHMGGKDLDQDVTETIDQMTGKEPIPPDHDDYSRDIQWNDIEEPMAYGYGARQQYGQQYPSWDNGLERTLRNEWEQRGSAARTWDDVRGYVRRGYDRT
jgi:hypothetical protein